MCRLKLAKFFDPYNKRLEKILGYQLYPAINPEDLLKEGTGKSQSESQSQEEVTEESQPLHQDTVEELDCDALKASFEVGADGKMPKTYWEGDPSGVVYVTSNDGGYPHHPCDPPSIWLPSLAVVGSQKCGTTSIRYWLKQHPHIQLSQAEGSLAQLKACSVETRSRVCVCACFRVC